MLVAEPPTKRRIMKYYDLSIQYLLAEMSRSGGAITVPCARVENETLRVLDRMESDSLIEIAGRDALRVTYRMTEQGRSHYARTQNPGVLAA